MVAGLLADFDYGNVQVCVDPDKFGGNRIERYENNLWI